MTSHEPDAIVRFLILLLIASATCIGVKWIKVPYSVALVIAGLIAGLLQLIPPIVMTPEVVLLVFLPALLFEAAWNLDLQVLRQNWLSITVLATVGVVVCMLAVAAVLCFGGGIAMSTALLFGAMVSATDPVSVIALFKELGINKRLTMILEGESLFNDGTAVVLFQLVLAILVSGKQWTPLGTAGEFVLIVVGGAILGAALGFLASAVTKAFDDHLLEITLTVVTAYGAFIIADHLKVSPVIAVVAAGIVVGNYGGKTGMSTSTRVSVNDFWEYAAFLVNSLLFLLIGLQIKWPLMVKYAPLIGLGVAAVLVARILVIYGICPCVSTRSLPIPMAWRHILFWGGLRGALVMALALSIPHSYAEREALINMTFGLVLFTLLIPGITMEPLAKFLKLEERGSRISEYQSQRAITLAMNMQLKSLQSLNESLHIATPTYDALKLALETRLREAQAKLESIKIDDQQKDAIELRVTNMGLAKVHHAVLNQLAKETLIEDDLVQKLILDIDVAVHQLGQEPLKSQTETEIAATRGDKESQT